MLIALVAALFAVDAGSAKADAGVVVKADAGLKDAGVATKDAGVPDAGKPKDAGVAQPVLPVIPTKLPDGGVLATCKPKPVICFSPEGDCDLQVVAVIDRALPGETLDIIIYSINRESIISSVLRAKARKVVVRLVIDSSQIQDPKEQPQLRRLLAAGIPMKRDTHQGIMHMKVVVRNAQEFVIGSFNFTNNASENNDENLLAWDCQKYALVYETKFDGLWGKFKDATEMVMRDFGSKDGG